MSVSEYIRAAIYRRRLEVLGEGIASAEQTVLLRLLTLLKKRDSLPPITAADLRSLGPIHICSCGCSVFNVFAQFEDYEISWWALDATCANCGNLVRIPCPVDKDA
jgi:hypothetical protein